MVLEVIATFFFHETYIPTLLKWKLSKAKKLDGAREWYGVLEIGNKNAGKPSLPGLALEASRPGTHVSRLSTGDEYQS